MINTVEKFRILLVKNLISYELFYEKSWNQWQKIQNDIKQQDQDYQNNPKLMNKLIRNQKRFKAIEDRYYSIMALTELNLGFEGEYIPLFQSCFIFDEYKVNKAIITNPEDIINHESQEEQYDIYEIQFCPYQNITQTLKNGDNVTSSESILLGKWNTTTAYINQANREALNIDDQIHFKYEKVKSIDVRTKYFN